MIIKELILIAFTSLDEEARRTHPPSTRDEINRQNFKLWNLCGRPNLPLLTDYRKFVIFSQFFNV